MVTTYSEYFCFQHQELLTDIQGHLTNYPDHCIIEIVTTESGVVYGPGHADDLVAPDVGTSTIVISGFPTIEDAINYIVTSGVPQGMPTQVIEGYPTIESAINFIVTSGFPSGTPTTTLSGYNTIEGAIEDIQSNVSSSRIRNYSYSDEGGNIGLVNASSCYKTVQVMIFEGSSVMGIPSEIKAVVKKKSSGTAGIRIVDITNNDVICELTDFSESDYTVKDLGNIANISSTEVIWEIQIKKCYCAAISIKF